MRRAALCLLSALAFGVAPPAFAQEAVPSDERIVERPSGPPTGDPAALTSKPPAEGEANVSTSSTPLAAREEPASVPTPSERASGETETPATATAPEEAPAAEASPVASPAEPASSAIETSSIPDAKPASDVAPAATEPPAEPAAQDTASPDAPAAAPSGEPTIAPQAPATATPDPAPQPAPFVATPAEPPPPPPVNAALLAAIESSQPKARQGQEREWHDAISAFYSAREGLPMWTTDSGLSTTGEALTAEMRRADEWGLDPQAFDLTGLPAGSAGPSPEALAEAELKLTRALLTYAWHARGGRVDPLELSKWLDQSPRPLDAKALLEQFSTASDPSVALQKLHPQHRQFELLRQAYLKARTAKEDAEAEDPREVTISKGPVVRVGDRHPDVELVRRRLEIPARTDDDADLYDEDVAAGVHEFLGPTYRDRKGRTVRRATHPALTNYVRSQLSKKTRRAENSKPTLKQYLVNLERWRWMPENLGGTYVWNNLPEYTTRVIQNGRVIHQERIIIGKPTNQTPVFSDEMQFVVFHPDWGVPGTIKVQDLLPSLQSGDDSVLERRNMRIVQGNRTVRAYQIDWERTDIRSVSIIQDPGPSNPLGQLKFMFPNKHDVYMHDTPSKQLFDKSNRALSFGCIRVRNPVRLAEIVFGRDRNWNQSDITDLLRPRAAQNNRVDLNKSVPVHNVYFTLVADESGSVAKFDDVYDHDPRIQAVLLDGKSAADVARSDPARALERKVKQLAANPPPRRDSGDYGWGGWGWGPPPRERRGRRNYDNDFFSGIFGN